MRLLVQSTLLLVLVSAAPLPAAAASEPIGQTLFVRGGVTQEPKDAAPRIIGKGSPLFEGDVLRTGAGSFAVLRFNDGTRATIRPNTAFTVEEYSHQASESEDAKPERAFMRLFKGGLRMVTGLIGKRNKEGFQLNTSVATIGIRGTDFEARICDAECQEEAKKVKDGARKLRTGVVARMSFLTGEVTAKSLDGKRRTLVLGGSLFEGDIVTTKAGALAVVVFLDESRVTLRADSKFKIIRHRYSEGDPEKSNMLMRLLSGSVRVVSGLVAKVRPEKYQVRTPVATLSVRGTGFEMKCEGDCKGEPQSVSFLVNDPLVSLLNALVGTAHAQGQSGLNVWVFQGTVALLDDKGAVRGVINQDQAVFLPGVGAAPVVLPVVPAAIRNAPVPNDDPSLQGQNLTKSRDASFEKPQVLLTVNEGDAELKDQKTQQIILVGAGETAAIALDGSGVPERVITNRATKRTLQLPDPDILSASEGLSPLGEGPIDTSGSECAVP